MANSEGSAGEICGGKFKSMTKAWSIFAPGLFALFVLRQISMKDSNDAQEIPLLVLGHGHQMGVDFADHRAAHIGFGLFFREEGRDRYTHSRSDFGHSIDCGVLQRPFDLSQMGRADASLECQFLLAHVSFVSQFPDTQSERSSNFTQYPHLSLILEGILKSCKSL